MVTYSLRVAVAPVQLRVSRLNELLENSEKNNHLAMLEIINLKFDYNKAEVLRDINLTISIGVDDLIK